MPAAGQPPVNLHGTALAVDGKAVLIRGPSGSGKSDLALRTIGMAPSRLFPAPALLVADDRVIVGIQDGELSVSAPDTLRGLIEVRGVGIVSVSVVERARLVLIADLCGAAEVPRLPEEDGRGEIILGRPIVRTKIFPFEASAPIKLLLALARAP